MREDLSEKLIHLTRCNQAGSGENNFLKILNEKNIKGAKTSIESNHDCICFSEAPISSLGRIISAKRKEVRYSQYGFMFSKEYIFSLGGRPVIYQPKSEYNLLPEELQYRHVDFNLSRSEEIINWTWEREWRLKTENLPLYSEKVTLIIPNRIFLEKIIEQEQSEKRKLSLGTFGAFPQTKWHFIVLEDLGFEVNLDDTFSVDCQK